MHFYNSLQSSPEVQSVFAVDASQTRMCKVFFGLIAINSGRNQIWKHFALLYFWMQEVQNLQPYSKIIYFNLK